jgi:hypothetical protein
MTTKPDAVMCDPVFREDHPSSLQTAAMAPSSFRLSPNRAG